MNIRRFKIGDEDILWRLYYETTHRINGQEYTKEQVERWAPKDKDMIEWSRRVRVRNPFVAEDDGIIVGFAELEANGHIDFFYCHHLWQRKGVGRMLYEALENEARGLNLRHLRSEVSVPARAFFEAMGFRVTVEQNNVVCGSVAKNYVMEKQIN